MKPNDNRVNALIEQVHKYVFRVRDRAYFLIVISKSPLSTQKKESTAVSMFKNQCGEVSMFKNQCGEVKITTCA